jgi:hypothetical protein
VIEEIDIYRESQKRDDFYDGIVEPYNKEKGFEALANKLNEVIEVVNRLMVKEDEQ